MPPGAATGRITVSNGVDLPVDSTTDFKVTPKITGFTPASAAPGTSFEIDGSNLGGATKVLFGTVPTLAATFTSNTDDKIVLDVPANAVSGKLTVTTPSGSGVSTDSFIAILPPTITSFTPAFGPVGSLVTVTGSHLDAVTSAKVGVVDVTDPIQHVSGTQLRIVVPAGAVTGQIQVQNAIPQSGSSANKFKVTPKITGFTPAVALPNTPVEIDGSNFLGATTTTVKVGSGAATAVIPDSDSTIHLTIPSSASSGKLTVTTSEGSGVSADTLVVAKPPKITSFTPASGPAGTVVTLNGSNLDGVSGATIGGTDAVLQHVSGAQAKVTVPAGAVTGLIAVTGIGGGASSTTAFKVTPKITGFSPASGAAGSAVGIDGTGFTAATKVQFGSVATNFSVDSDLRISAIVPTGAVTNKITVTTPSGAGASATSFTVTAAPTPKVSTSTSRGRTSTSSTRRWRSSSRRGSSCTRPVRTS